MLQLARKSPVQSDQPGPRRTGVQRVCCGVRIAVLLFTQRTVEKLAAHAIAPEEVRQINEGDRIVIRNPRPRVEGSVLMIGPTHGGRVLTIVLNPEPVDPGAWHVRTGWPASTAQIGRYHRDR